MLMTLLILTTLVALALAGSAAIRVRQLAVWLRDHNVELGAIRDRIGLTDSDVDDWHDRVHPECAETGGRS